VGSNNYTTRVYKRSYRHPLQDKETVWHLRCAAFNIVCAAERLLNLRNVSVKLARCFEREIRCNIWEMLAYLEGKRLEEVLSDE